MNYRLLVTDLDDTLLGEDQVISIENKQAIARAREVGVTVCIATGRMLHSSERFARELGLVTEPMICCQGAVIVDMKTGEVVHSRAVPKALALEVLAYAQEQRLYIHYVNEETYFVRDYCAESDIYVRLCGVKGVELHDRFEEELIFDPQKLLAIDQPERIRTLYRHAKEHWGDRLEVTVSRPMFLEFTHHEAHKGFALKILAQRLGIPLSETIAIGDGYNDISMIRAAGLGVAIGNAAQALKDAADYIAPPSREHGVAHVIEKFILS